MILRYLGEVCPDNAKYLSFIHPRRRWRTAACGPAHCRSVLAPCRAADLRPDRSCQTRFPAPGCRDVAEEIVSVPINQWRDCVTDLPLKPPCAAEAASYHRNAFLPHHAVRAGIKTRPAESRHRYSGRLRRQIGGNRGARAQNNERTPQQKFVHAMTRPERIHVLSQPQV